LVARLIDSIGADLAEGDLGRAFAPPDTPPRARGEKTSVMGLFGLDVLSKVRDKAFWIFIVCVIFIVVNGLPT